MRNTVVKTIVAAVAVAALQGCSPPAAPSAPAPKASSETAFAFDVNVTATPAAAAIMSSRRDGIIVAAHYYGFPAAGFTDKVDNIGQVALGEDRIGIVANATVVHMPASGLNQKILPEIEGSPYVLVSASSAAPDGASDESLVCTFFRGTIAYAKTGKASITCDAAPPEADDSDKVVR